MVDYHAGAPMCVRYTLKSDPAKIAERFGLTEVSEYRRRYNLGPTQLGLIVRAGVRPDSRAAAWLRWGLIPSWSKASGDATGLFNARGETVAAKPAFRDALKRRRCLVLADGYYEWAQQGTTRQPHYFTVNRGEPFAMAGLWDRWCPPGGTDEDTVETYTIITTTANDLIAPIHERMPVILEPDFYEDWLNPLVTDAGALQPLIKAYPGVRMFARAVSRRVNNLKYDDSACLDGPDADGANQAPPTGSHTIATPPAAGQMDLGLGS